MKKNNVLIVLSIILSVLNIACSSKNKETKDSVKAYTPVSQELFAEIAHMDSVLFDAFNAYDIEKTKTIFSDSLEFYHDKGGLAGYNQTIENLKKLFENNKTTGLRRDLVKGSMEVYPINDYGAVETGLHTFCHDENGKQDCGTFKFMHLWQKKEGQWKITRVVSYDH